MFELIPLKNGLDNIKNINCDGILVNENDKKKLGLAFISTNKTFKVSAIFTNNSFQAAPIKHFKSYEENFETNFILINSKNANALTGQKGVSDIKEILSTLSFKTLNPIMSSTGVIGEYLDKNLIINTAKQFNFNAKNSHNAAKAIMTTDKFSKEIAFRVNFEDKSFHIAAIAKGAGMINPNLATMLCFIVTDAKIPTKDMKEMLKKCNETTFNAISVDGDTSTNDTVMLLANDESGVYQKEAFEFALQEVMKFIALEILRDGEGSSKVAAFVVKNAKTYHEAQKVAKNLSNSLLVKTALFGCDPNWGRIASTIGASNVSCDEAKLEIFYDNVKVYNGEEFCFSKEIEKKAQEVLQKSSYKIICNLNAGDFSYTAYGCDLGHEYVKINSDYRS